MQKSKKFITNIYSDNTCSQIKRRMSKYFGFDKTFIINRDMERYYYLINSAIGSLDLTRNEAMFLCHLLISTRFETPESSGWVYMSIEDEDPVLLTHYSIDRDALVAKVRGWSKVQQMALVDAHEQITASELARTDVVACMIKIGLLKEV